MAQSHSTLNGTRRRTGSQPQDAASRFAAGLDPRAIENGVGNLWCLASCRFLLGSHGSTFSEAAYQLKGIPHRILDVG